MPKFAPNTGFKMPGIGSKDIDSPGNFRDEHHVDKVGYCDTTDDSMLPEGSSPLKVRYASSGYLKDLDSITIPQKKKKKKEADNVDPVVKEEKKGSSTQLLVPDYKVKLPEVDDKKYVIKNNKTEGKKNPRESVTVKTPGRSMRKAYDIALEKGYRSADESFEDYSARAMKDKNYGKGGSVTITGEKLKKE